MASRRDPNVTSRIMRSVRDRDSKAELLLRSTLHRRGVRFRLHASDITGRPDVVIRSLRLAVFVDGDFWHGNEHRRRGLDRLENLFPTNTEWWVEKINANVQRDRRVTEELKAAGWIVVRLWESEVLDDPEGSADRVIDALAVARSERNHG